MNLKEVNKEIKDCKTNLRNINKEIKDCKNNIDDLKILLTHIDKSKNEEEYNHKKEELNNYEKLLKELSNKKNKINRKIREIKINNPHLMNNGGDIEFFIKDLHYLYNKRFYVAYFKYNGMILNFKNLYDFLKLAGEVSSNKEYINYLLANIIDKTEDIYILK